MTKVEFVIIAFPKCGTTSLVENLNKHSKINCYYDCGSKESKVFYFIQKVFIIMKQERNMINI